jgi:hypothetical protein
MAFIHTEKGWAWVDSPSEVPQTYHATKDEALAAVKKDGKTFDAAPAAECVVLTTEKGEWV